MKKVKLKEGEYLCSKCDGHGVVILIEDSAPKITICERCDGKGKYDWLEYATGRIDKSRPYTKNAEDWIIRDMLEFIKEKNE